MNLRALVIGICLLGGSTQSVGCRPETGRRAEVSRWPSADDLSGFSVASRNIRPTRPAAERYGESIVYPLSPVESEIERRLAVGGLTHSPALSTMTRELAEATRGDLNVPPALVDVLMAWAGLVDPQPRLLIVELAGDRARCDLAPSPACEGAFGSLVAQATLALPGGNDGADAQRLLFGVGVVALGEGRTRMIVALLQPALTLEPIDVAVPSGAVVQIRGRLHGARSKPYVEVVANGGPGDTVPVALSVDGTFSSTVQCGDDGPVQIEVLAQGVYGPEVAANFPVYCGVSAPQSLEVEVEVVGPDVDAAQLARANFIFLNEARERRGLPALIWDPDAAAVARKHSQDMHDAGFIGHRSPSTGDVTARFDQAGLVGTVIRENVALGSGPRGIHDSLMRSPGHRVNMLAADVTHVGVGAVIGAAESKKSGASRPVFATQNFYKKPGAGAPADARLAPTVRSRVDTLRRDAALGPMAWDEALSEVAAAQARAIADGGKPAADLDAQVFALGFVAMASHQLASIDFDALTTVALWRETLPDAVGVGVARMRETRTSEGGFVAVVIVAERP